MKGILRTFDSMKRTDNHDYEILLNINKTVATIQDRSQLLKTIFEQLQPIFSFHDVGLFVVNEAENYHVDLAVSSPEISPSAVNHRLHDLLGDQRVVHRGSSVAWTLEQIEAAQGPVLMDFADLFERFPEYAQLSIMPTLSDHYRDCLATLLRAGGKLVGMFCINALRTEAFTHVDRSFFQSVADLIAVAVSNVLANEEVLLQKQRVEQLLTISQAVTEIKDRKQLLKTIYERIKPIFPYDSYGLFVLTEDGQQHYELIDAEIMDNDPSQVAVEQQHEAHYRYSHADSSVEAMM